MAKPKLIPKSHEVRHLFYYLPYDGILKWRKHRFVTNGMGGKPAGSIKKQGKYTRFTLKIKEGEYSCAAICWVYLAGFYPTGNLKFIDGDCTNIKANNIEHKGERLSLFIKER